LLFNHEPHERIRAVARVLVYDYNSKVIRCTLQTVSEENEILIR